MQIEEGVIHRGQLNIPNWAQSPLFICMAIKILLSNGSDHKEHKAGSVIVDCLTTQEVNFKNLVHFFQLQSVSILGIKTKKCAHILQLSLSRPHNLLEA